MLNRRVFLLSSISALAISSTANASILHISHPVIDGFDVHVDSDLLNHPHINDVWERLYKIKEEGKITIWDSYFPYDVILDTNNKINIKVVKSDIFELTCGYDRSKGKQEGLSVIITDAYLAKNNGVLKTNIMSVDKKYTPTVHNYNPKSHEIYGLTMLTDFKLKASKLLLDDIEGIVFSSTAARQRYGDDELFNGMMRDNRCVMSKTEMEKMFSGFPKKNKSHKV